MLIVQDIKRERWVLTEEGRTYVAAGSPEVQVFLAIPPEGISPEELQRKMDPAVFKIGRSQAIKNQWLEMGKQLVTKKVNIKKNFRLHRSGRATYVLLRFLKF
ncbi:phenylalanine--tRNA ligase alpha subunit, cytoplasmic-like [Camellia sinensis]|uniref:phenylalanine--tRNA ligase alpha subunit, cytoplasmic-like n=1 Tax=Camellia sinensis TaxID=4442 RepID=UPI00103610AF|nr:phenylalanine--tRNA ligase alpha subunit, cytoplasmic-like [Camellia sinensis]